MSHDSHYREHVYVNERFNHKTLEKWQQMNELTLINQASEVVKW